MKNWLVAIAVSLLTGLVGMFSLGCLGIVWVEWYAISSFEGASGFFVVGMALLGGFLGGIVGIAAATLVALRKGRVRFVSLLGYAWGSWLALLVVATGVSWACAGFPFAIGGDGVVADVEYAHDTADFQSLRPDAPIKYWLPFSRIGVPDEQRTIALTHITSRGTLVSELSALMQSDDLEVASDAIRLIQYLPEPQSELIPVLTDIGNHIIRQIESVNATSIEQDPEFLKVAEVSTLFSAWIDAANHLRQHCDADFSAELKRILELSRVRSDSRAMRQDVCRVASNYMQQWTGLEPLPTDSEPD